MDIEKIRALPKYHRWTFIALLLAIAIILVLVDRFLLADPTSNVHFLSPYVQSVVEAIAVGLLVLWIFVSFTPPDESRGGLEQLEPNRITSEFDEMLRDTQRWRYKGNFGRYERGKVLPTLAGRQNAHAIVSIIDPSNERLCRQHAEYRNSIQAIDRGRIYDANKVALEVVVTIVHCAWYVAKRQIAIDLYLSSVFDPVRIDSNDHAMILTVEDRRSPALKLTRRHFMYEHFELQMRYAREQGRKLTLDGLVATPTIGGLSAEHVEQFLGQLGMRNLSERLDPEVIAKACREAENPYVN